MFYYIVRFLSSEPERCLAYRSEVSETMHAMIKWRKQIPLEK